VDEACRFRLRLRVGFKCHLYFQATTIPRQSQAKPPARARTPANAFSPANPGSAHILLVRLRLEPQPKHSACLINLQYEGVTDYALDVAKNIKHGNVVFCEGDCRQDTG
jgi:hypothetical protein